VNQNKQDKQGSSQPSDIDNRANRPGREGNSQGGRQIDDNQDDLGRDVNDPGDVANDINDVDNKRGNMGKSPQRSGM
jgi:hypothetical protein